MAAIRKASLVILERNGKILFIRRHNTGYSDGLYTLPSGSVDEDESFVEAAVRETKEEVDLLIQSNDLKSVHIVFEETPSEEWVHHFFLTKAWKGEVKNLEPHKCDHIEWFDIDKLPDKILPYVEIAIKNIYGENNNFSEMKTNVEGRT